MCLHGALFCIHFTLICNMTTLCKECFDFLNPAQGGCKDKLCMCLHGALCSIQINLICNVTTFGNFFLTFDPNPGIERVCKDRVCACMLLLSSFPYFLTLILRVGEGGSTGKIFATILVYTSFPLI